MWNSQEPPEMPDLRRTFGELDFGELGLDGAGLPPQHDYGTGLGASYTISGNEGHPDDAPNPWWNPWSIWTSCGVKLTGADFHPSRKTPGLTDWAGWNALLRHNARAVIWSAILCLTASLHVGFVLGWDKSDCATMEFCELLSTHHYHAEPEDSAPPLGSGSLTSFSITCKWVGAAVGAVAGGWLAHCMGHRPTLLLALPLGVGGELMHAMARGNLHQDQDPAVDIAVYRQFVGVLLAGKILLGFSVGIVSVGVPLYRPENGCTVIATCDL